MYQESVVAMYTDGDLGVSVGGNMCLGPIGDVEVVEGDSGEGFADIHPG